MDESKDMYVEAQNVSEGGNASMNESMDGHDITVDETVSDDAMGVAENVTEDTIDMREITTFDKDAVELIESGGGLLQDIEHDIDPEVGLV